MPRRPAGALLSVALEPRSRTPLHRQIYDGVRRAILDGRLPPGTRLPSTRSIAGDLAVSRMTVLDAFAQLSDEGYLVGRVGSGTHVSRTIPDTRLTAAAGRPLLPGAGPRPSLSERSHLFEGGLGKPAAPGRPFWPANPAVDAFPVREWATRLARHWRSIRRSELEYGAPSGHRRLREALAAYVGRARGVRCTGDQVMVVNGAQQAFFLCAQLLLDPRDVAWMEEPGYPYARLALRSTGARVVSVPVDEEGLVVARGRGRGSPPKLVYVTPAHQCPLGVAMTVSRRLELLQFARDRNAWVLEDDYDSEYRYGSRPLPALQSLDRDGRVVYVGSLSKTLLPALRIGFAVLPPSLVEPFGAVRAVIDRHPPGVEQGALAAFIEDGSFERHIRRMRALYLERRQVLLEGLRAGVGDAIRVGGTDAGLYVVGWLHGVAGEPEVVASAAAHGVAVVPLSGFYQGTPPRPGLVLGYGAYSPAAIRDGARRLGKAIAAATSTARARGTGGHA
jgi:GntR family transcriptional regulator / MocR family aminotransferase